MQLTICDVGYGGQGVARTAEGVVFIPGAFTGETVEADIIIKKKKFAQARLREVLAPSPDRITPTSRWVPGMTYDTLAYPAEVALKQHQLATLLQRIGKFTALDFLKAPVASPLSLNYRNKLSLHSDGKQLGYIGEDNRTIVDTPMCPLCLPPINDALAQLREEGRTFKPDARVVFRYTPHDGVVIGTPPKGELTEQVAGLTLSVAAEAFFQINLSCAELLLDAFRKQVQPSTSVLDLYCGCGLFGLVAAQAGAEQIFGLETSPGAIRSAQRNAKQLGITAYYRCAPSEALLETKVSADTWIVDPPRDGLSPVVVQKLLAQRPRYVHYISCGPDTLARDLKLLSEVYTIASVQLFDFFPRTPHFESLCFLTRKI